MIKVKPVHRVMPDKVLKILDYIADSKGEESFFLLDEEEQLNAISMLCDNPTEWADKIKTHE